MLWARHLTVVEVAGMQVHLGTKVCLIQLPIVLLQCTSLGCTPVGLDRHVRGQRRVVDLILVSR
jgi:hypothetical protein